MGCSLSGVKVAATGYVWRRGDPVVVLWICGASAASDRVAGSVQRVIAAAVAEPVKAVRPPEGHPRVVDENLGEINKYNGSLN